MTAADPDFDVAWFGRPRDGESVGGDAAVQVRRPDGAFVAVIDVLGHGPSARRAADLAVAELLASADPDLTEVLRRLHEALRGGPGAALAVAFAERAGGRLRFAGVGNVAGRVLGAAEVRLVGRDGVVGQGRRSPREQTAVLRPGDLLLLTTDGVTGRFGPDEYPGLAFDAAERVARTVVARWGRPHDDALCLALRYRPGERT